MAWGCGRDRFPMVAASVPDTWLQPRLSTAAASTLHEGCSRQHGCSRRDPWLQPAWPVVAASVRRGRTQQRGSGKTNSHMTSAVRSSCTSGTASTTITTCGQNHGVRHVRHARGGYTVHTVCVPWSTNCPVPPVRTARRWLVRVACTYRTEAPGRTCQHRPRPPRRWRPCPRRAIV